MENHLSSGVRQLSLDIPQPYNFLEHVLNGFRLYQNQSICASCKMIPNLEQGGGSFGSDGVVHGIRYGFSWAY